MPYSNHVDNLRMIIQTNLLLIENCLIKTRFANVEHFWNIASVFINIVEQKCVFEIDCYQSLGLCKQNEIPCSFVRLTCGASESEIFRVYLFINHSCDLVDISLVNSIFCVQIWTRLDNATLKWELSWNNKLVVDWMVPVSYRGVLILSQSSERL